MGLQVAVEAEGVYFRSATNNKNVLLADTHEHMSVKTRTKQ